MSAFRPFKLVASVAVSLIVIPSAEASTRPDSAARKAGIPRCPTWMVITEAPPLTSFSTSVRIKVEYGALPEYPEEGGGTGPCYPLTSPSEETFTFTVNGVNRLSYFTVYADSAVGTNVPLTDGITNTMTATMAGFDSYGMSTTHVHTVETFVAIMPPPTVYSTVINYQDQNAGRCAVSCFAAVYGQSTVPYFVRDAQQSVTLAYHGDRMSPRPFVHVDIQHPAAAANTPVQFRLAVKVSGSTVQFLNNETVLRFQYASGVRRIGGQFDASGYATGVYPMEIIVTSLYVDGDSVFIQDTVSTKLTVVNENASAVGRGWTIGGVQRAYQQSDGSLLITDGFGSATYFAKVCSGSCTYTTPAGDFSKIVDVSPSGWRRLYPDSTKVTFDNTGRSVSIRDRFGNLDSLVYSSGRLWKLHDRTGRQIVLSYGTYGISSIADPMSRTTTITVASDSTLRVIKDPDGDSTRFIYDGSRRLEQMVDRRGSTTRLWYNSTSWKLDSVVAPAIPINGGGSQSPKTALQPWHVFGVPTSSTSGTPAASIRIDSVLAQITDPEGHNTKLAVDRWGQPTAIIDAVSRPTAVAYDANGLPATINFLAYPNWSQENFSWDGNGNVTYHSGTGIPTVSIRYGAYAQIDSVWGSNGLALRAFLGTAGRTDSIRYKGSDSLKVRFTYDAQGRVLTQKDPKNHVTSFHYHASFGSRDSTNLAGSGGMPGARFLRVRFDQYGRDSAVSGADEPWRRTVYDVLNRPIQFYDGLNTNPTTYTYDRLFLTRVKDPKGQVYRFAVNALGLVTQRFDPADTLTRYDSYRYDRDGLTIGWTNRRSQALTYTFDAIHRLTFKSGTNAVSDTFSFANDGRMVVSSNSVARDTTYYSPGIMWVDSVITRFGGQRFKVTRHVSGTARLDSTKVSSSTAIRFVTRRNRYNSATGLLDSIALDASRIALASNGDGLEARVTLPTTPNIVMGRTFTSLHRLRDDTLTPGPLNLTLGHRYGYDSRGRMAFDLKAGASTWREFGYDDLGRLTSLGALDWGAESSCSWTEENGWGCYNPGGGSSGTFEYDEVGNRTNFGDGTYTTGNRITAFTGSMESWNFTHDLDGNVSVKARPGAAPDINYFWSADGLLDSVVATSTKIQYGYDAQGRLVRKRRNGATQRYFLWDGAQIIAELDSIAQKRVGEYAYYPGIDRPLALVTGDTAPTLTRYFRQDGSFNVIGVLKDTSVKQTIVYDPWGAQSVFGGTVGDTNRLRWKGLLWEGDSTRLYYMRARWYDPSIGRFFSEDPLGLVAGINPYEFAGGNPIDGTDPMGLGEDYFWVGNCLWKRVWWEVSTQGGGSESGVASYLVGCVNVGSGGGSGLPGGSTGASSKGGGSGSRSGTLAGPCPSCHYGNPPLPAHNNPTANICAMGLPKIVGNLATDIYGGARSLGNVLAAGGGVIQLAIMTGKGLPGANIQSAAWQFATSDAGPGTHQVVFENIISSAWPGAGTGMAVNDFMENCNGVLWR